MIGGNTEGSLPPFLYPLVGDGLRAVPIFGFKGFFPERHIGRSLHDPCWELFIAGEPGPEGFVAGQGFLRGVAGVGSADQLAVLADLHMENVRIVSGHDQPIANAFVGAAIQSLCSANVDAVARYRSEES